MLDPLRWRVEREIMRQHFPWISPFETANGYIGFFGHLRGPRWSALRGAAEDPARSTRDPSLLSTSIRALAITGDGRRKPQSTRQALLRPPWQSKWDPARSTFANCVMVALDYLKVQGA